MVQKIVLVLKNWWKKHIADDVPKELEDLF